MRLVHLPGGAHDYCSIGCHAGLPVAGWSGCTCQDAVVVLSGLPAMLLQTLICCKEKKCIHCGMWNSN